MRYLSPGSIILLSLLFAHSAAAGFFPINGGMVNQGTIVTAATGNTALVATSNQIQIIEGTAPQTVTLPDATGLPVNWWYDIINNSTGDVTVKDNAASTLATISTRQMGKFQMTARASAAGTWKKIILAGLSDIGVFSGTAALADALSANPTDCSVGQFATAIAANGDLTCGTPAGTGDVTGPASSTDNGVARFDSTTGKIIKNSGVTIDDSDVVTASGGFVGDLTGNADTVTTNADLTGPITSTGNATAVAAQTGTGSTFVMDDTPTLITPILGVATATSIGAANGNVTTPSFYTATGSGNTGFYFGANGASFGYNGTEVFSFINTILKTNVRFQINHNGSASTVSQYLESDANTGWYGGSDGQWFWSSNGSQILDFSSSGLGVTGTASATAFSGPLTGNVTGDLTGDVTGNADTATALAANPSDCSANNFATTIAANGNLTCAQPAFSDLSGSATIAQKTTATSALSTCTTARTIDWSTSNDFTLLLTSGNACTLTFSNAVSGQKITIELTNGSGAGDATVVWPSTRWEGGTAPTMTTGAAALDICTIKYNGSAYSGSCIQDMSVP